MLKFYVKAYKTLAKWLNIRENEIEILKISKTLNAHKLKRPLKASPGLAQIERLSLYLPSNHALVTSFYLLFQKFAF